MKNDTICSLMERLLLLKKSSEMKDDTMLNRKPFNNLLDYVKSKYLEQDHLWKELHYLKNFKIYSLLNH